MEFINITIAQLNFQVGDLEGNLKKIFDAWASQDHLTHLDKRISLLCGQISVQREFFEGKGSGQLGLCGVRKLGGWAG
jgi:hypothetical protein